MVKFAPKLTVATGITDCYEGINVPRMREERPEKARQEMKRQGIPALLVTADQNVRYLTGFHFSEFQPYIAYTLFFAEDDPIIFAHAGSYQTMPGEMPWIKHWRIGRSSMGDVAGEEGTAAEYSLFAKEIRAELKERGLAKEKLGIACFDLGHREALIKEGITLVEAFPLLLEASKCKTKDEVKCLQMAASIAGVGWQKVIDIGRPGMTEVDMNRQVMDAMWAAGAEKVHGLPISGPFTFQRNVTPHNRRMEAGDMFYYPLCGTSFLGYTMCSYRCFKIGTKPNDKEKGWYNRVRDTIQAVADACIIGNTTADAARFFPPASKWGYKDEAEVLSIEWGHGIGLVTKPPSWVSYNLPAINNQWSLKYPQPFEKGMVIAIESCEGEQLVNGARLEYMIEVTENGPERLDFFPDDEIIPVGLH